LIVQVAQTAHQAEDKFVGCVETHQKQSKASAVKQRAQFAQVFEQPGRLGEQKKIFEHDLDAESDEKVFQGVANHVFKAAVRVLADFAFLKKSLR